jgi:LysM repeat protein
MASGTELASASRAALPARTRTTGPHGRNDGAVGGLRLTRRGRVLALLIVVAALLAVFSLGRFAAPASSSPPPRTITVSAGQTLWQIARQVAPEVDPRATVARLEALNHLDGPQVHAGQPLLVPGK